jgi:hypothetical protein
MLADLAALTVEHYNSLLLIMLAGACFALAGMLAIFIWRRRDVVMGEPDVPTYVPPTPTRILLPPRHRREDADTRAIPYIPGATRVLAEFLDDVEDVTTALRVIEHDEPVTAELLQRVRDGLTGPACPTCPFGNCTCYGQKNSDMGFDYPPSDECPLTTGEIEIPTEGESPLFRQTFVRYPHAELTTQNLTAALERAKESVA